MSILPARAPLHDISVPIESMQVQTHASPPPALHPRLLVPSATEMENPRAVYANRPGLSCTKTFSFSPHFPSRLIFS